MASSSAEGSALPVAVPCSSSSATVPSPPTEEGFSFSPLLPVVVVSSRPMAAAASGGIDSAAEIFSLFSFSCSEAATAAVTVAPRTIRWPPPPAADDDNVEEDDEDDSRRPLKARRLTPVPPLMRLAMFYSVDRLVGWYAR